MLAWTDARYAPIVLIVGEAEGQAPFTSTIENPQGRGAPHVITLELHTPRLRGCLAAVLGAASLVLKASLCGLGLALVAAALVVGHGGLDVLPVAASEALGWFALAQHSSLLS